MRKNILFFLVISAFFVPVLGGAMGARNTATFVPILEKQPYPQKSSQYNFIHQTKGDLSSLFLDHFNSNSFSVAQKNLNQSPINIADKKPTWTKHTRSSNKKRRDRKPGNTLDKEDLLGEDYYKPINSTEVRKNISQHIITIEGICKTNQNADKRAVILESTLTELRNTIDSYLAKPYLSTQDSIYLRDIKENTSEIALGFGLSQNGSFIQNKETYNLSNNFLRSYYSYFNIEAGDTEGGFTPEGLKHKWAVQIYKGLNCL